MVTTCWVKGCKNRAGINQVSFFRFPRRPENRRKVWIENIIRHQCHPKMGEDTKENPGLAKLKEPTKNDRVCSDHFITGKPSNDPLHPDYIPSLKMIPTKTPTRITRGTVRKKRATLDEAQKREEAANALLTMTKVLKPKGPHYKQKVCQTDPDPCVVLDKAKLNHLEKEIALLQRINNQLRAQKQIFEDALKRAASGYVTVYVLLIYVLQICSREIMRITQNTINRAKDR
ncbi:hypothetical protein RRG08_015701 [Elysia crispata]|uniref:THAP-type domain-containing protein n=1 Tax=Elysia crispata TaxID=231223 RepID=A0AAE1BDH2_9GAST|nr:hypothetical protein RRG08_015701 [Elysia crispata]